VAAPGERPDNRLFGPLLSHRFSLLPLIEARDELNLRLV
jgi:hypothetical protein